MTSLSKKLTLLIATFLLACSSLASDTGSTLLGVYGSILLHETGHATTSYLLGGKVLAFRPYPHRVKYLNADGSSHDKWVAGLVMSEPFQGEEGSKKNAWVAAMGSGANLLSVILLAPLLPEIKSDFSKSTLDSMLFFSSFDMAAYTTVDLISKDPNNDWNRVSELTGVSIYWYWVGGLIAGIAANEYRSYWHNKALPSDQRDSRFAVGFSSSY